MPVDIHGHVTDWFYRHWQLASWLDEVGEPPNQFLLLPPEWHDGVPLRGGPIRRDRGTTLGMGLDAGAIEPRSEAHYSMEAWGFLLLLSAREVLTNGTGELLADYLRRGWEEFRRVWEHLVREGSGPRSRANAC